MSKENLSGTYAVLSPTGRLGVPVVPAAPRPDSLNGKTVAFVWDYVFRGDEIFPVIEAELRAMFQDMRFIGPDAFGSIFGGGEAAVLKSLPQRLNELGVDGVVCGVGC